MEKTAQRSARRDGRLGRRGVAVALAAAVVLVLLGTVAYAAVLPTRNEAAKQVYHASGRVKIKNSLGRDPILGMRNMVPGDHVSGTVNIGNAGRMRARFSLGLSKLVEHQSSARPRHQASPDQAAAAARLLRTAARDAAAPARHLQAA
jgi:hypothetical protein